MNNSGRGREGVERTETHDDRAQRAAACWHVELEFHLKIQTHMYCKNASSYIHKTYFHQGHNVRTYKDVQIHSTTFAYVA